MRKLFQWVKGNSTIIVNASSLIGTTAVTSILGFVYWWVAARRFSADAVGISSAAVSAMMLLGNFSIMGMGTLLITELPRQPGRAKSLVSTSLLTVGIIGCVVGLLFALIAPYLSPGFVPLHANPLTIFFFALGVGSTAVTQVLDQSLIGLLRGGLQFWRNTLFAIAKLLLVCAVSLWLSRDGMTVYATWPLSNVLSLLLLLPFALRNRARIPAGEHVAPIPVGAAVADDEGIGPSGSPASEILISFNASCPSSHGRPQGSPLHHSTTPAPTENRAVPVGAGMDADEGWGPSGSPVSGIAHPSGRVWPIKHDSVFPAAGDPEGPILATALPPPLRRREERDVSRLLVLRQYRPQWSLLRKLGLSAVQHHLLNLTLQSPALMLPVLVTAMLSAKVNGWFYVSWMIANFVFLVPNALTIVLHAVNSAQQATLTQKARVTVSLALATCLLTNGVIQVAPKLILGAFGSAYADQASLSLRILVIAAFPLLVKNHYISICRIQDRIVNAMVTILPGSLLELSAAAVGAHVAGLLGLSTAWVAAVAVESLFMMPTVYRVLRGIHASENAPSLVGVDLPPVGAIWLIDTAPLPIIVPHISIATGSHESVPQLAALRKFSLPTKIYQDTPVPASLQTKKTLLRHDRGGQFRPWPQPVGAGEVMGWSGDPLGRLYWGERVPLEESSSRGSHHPERFHISGAGDSEGPLPATSSTPAPTGTRGVIYVAHTE